MHSCLECGGVEESASTFKLFFHRPVFVYNMTGKGSCTSAAMVSVLATEDVLGLECKYLQHKQVFITGETQCVIIIVEDAYIEIQQLDLLDFLLH